MNTVSYTHLKLDFVELYAPKTNENQIGVLSFNIKDVHPHDTATILSSCNVCVRAGDHCAQPLIRFLNLPATCRACLLYTSYIPKEYGKYKETKKFKPL